MNNRHCVIDIGTNSVRMLIAELIDDRLHVIKKDMEMTRIGKNVDKTKLLSQEAMDSTINALKKFKYEAEKENTSTINAIATSAVRDARNKSEFINSVKEEVGIDVEVITGEREAELGFKGVVEGVEAKGNILVIDIGGGSTELILGNSEGIILAKSIDIGAVRMTDKFITKDPAIEEELEQLNSYINKSLEDITDEINNYQIEKIVGIGGTITTLAAIKAKMDNYNRDIIHNSILDYKEIKGLLQSLITLDCKQRREIKGLQPKRADILLAGTQILVEILSLISKDSIVVSDYDNLEGYVFSIK